MSQYKDSASVTDWAAVSYYPSVLYAWSEGRLSAEPGAAWTWN